MATLESPGVQVTVIDESFYTPAAPGTVPMILVATAEDKTNPSGSTAQGTTAANAGKVWLITSQRDLTDTFGTPFFYTDASSNPLHGNELNEYGLQAAYSLLGVSSRAYVVRSDVDLTQLSPLSSAPEGEPVAGTHWVDTAGSTFGVKVWSSSTLKFTNVTPLVVHDGLPSTSFNGGDPSPSVGNIGDYCMVVSYNNNPNEMHLFYKDINNNWVSVQNNFDGGKSVVMGPHYNYPAWTSLEQSGSVWINTTAPNNGSNYLVKRYDSTSGWTSVAAPLYPSVIDATNQLDYSGGGAGIAVGSLFIEYSVDHNAGQVGNFKLWRRNATGPTNVTGPVAANSGTNATTYEFQIRESLPTTSNWSTIKTVIFTATNSTNYIGSYIPAAVSAAGLTYTSASWDATNKKLTLSHSLGGNFQINETQNFPLTTGCGFSTANATNLYQAAANDAPFDFLGTNWKPLSFEGRPDAPTTTPADGRLWYSSVVDEVDIMIHNGATWVGYKTTGSIYYSNGTDPAGPIVSATEPTEQSDGTALETGDIWISTADLERYGKDIYLYDANLPVGSRWVLQDTTDQSTPDGWLFADARWSTAGTTTEPATILDLLTSNYLDPDAPDPALYPKGMKLWNTRRSGFNVKKYVQGHIDITANNGQNIRYLNQSLFNYETDRWVSQNTTNPDGSGVFGRHAPRQYVVESMKSMVDANTTIRDTDTLNFNLLAAPGYPELIANLVNLNTDRGLTAFVVGDTPFRLLPTGTALSAYGNNTNGALDNNDDGLVSFDEYLGVYYPSGYTNDNSGNAIVVPPSHMMLRTIIKSDNVSFPWFAPAGTRRGGVDNATSVGYINSEGEFVSTALHQSLRDVLDDVKINPIATLSGVGLVAYGQRTRARNASALDRINVARLVCYLRKQLDVMARPFLFEPNDAQTRREIKAAAESIMLELVGQRALYDFIVVCDETNNTAARIDRNELYVDIAIEPVKAVEFIYIPLRLKNTGEIAALG